MSDIHCLFLDYDGVINDNSLAEPRWQFLVRELFVPRLGSTPSAWAEANKTVFAAVSRRSLARLEALDLEEGNLQDAGYRQQHERDLQSADWLRCMCAALGIQPPVSDEDCSALAREGESWAVPEIHRPFPGAAEVIAALAEQYRLFTASGLSSDELTAHLHGFGIAGPFQRIYGPDLVNTPKHGPAYYMRIFRDAGVDPTAAVVVDDTPRCIAWARAAGARGVFVNREGGSLDGAETIRSLGELQGVLQQL